VGRTGEARPAGPSGSLSTELGLRVLSGIVLVMVALGTTWLGGWAFAALWCAAGVVMAAEWIGLAGSRPRLPLILAAAAGLIGLAIVTRTGPWPAAPVLVIGATLVLLAFLGASTRDRLWAVSGLAYAAPAVAVPIVLRDRADLGVAAIFWLFAVVWATDIAAFFVGRRLGGPKLWPRVSPGKTWSGFAGGLIAGTLAALVVALLAMRAGQLLPLSLPAMAGAAALASVASQLGDLGESALKRYFGAKDSGHLIPGHGGVMDRLDGFVAVAFLVGLALLGARLAGTNG
jgi:phosphatidate cytidylyltransferase